MIKLISSFAVVLKVRNYSVFSKINLTQDYQSRVEVQPTKNVIVIQQKENLDKSLYM